MMMRPLFRSAMRSPTNTRRLVTLVGIGLMVLVTACEEQVIEQEPVVRPVKIHTIGEADPASRREYPGTIRALQHADMAFEVSGRITEFFVKEGDEVVQGEVLARLDPRDYEAELKASQANLRKAESDLRRSRNIYKEDPGAISTETIDTHKRAVDVSKAQLNISKKAVEDTELRAPFSGRMARKLVEDFQNVKAKEAVLVLQDTSTLEIQVNVPERDVATGTGGTAVTRREEITETSRPVVIVSAIPDRQFEAWVKEFASAADPVTRTFSVRLNFQNPGGVNILPGMTARVQVIVDRNRAWSVPATAVLADDDENPFVWKVEPDSMMVKRSPVEVGELFGSRVKIVGGVEDGDMIAISGVTQLRDGMKVRRLD